VASRCEDFYLARLSTPLAAIANAYHSHEDNCNEDDDANEHIDHEVLVLQAENRIRFLRLIATVGWDIVRANDFGRAHSILNDEA